MASMPGAQAARKPGNVFQPDRLAVDWLRTLLHAGANAAPVGFLGGGCQPCPPGSGATESFLAQSAIALSAESRGANFTPPVTNRTDPALGATSTPS